VKPLFSRYKDSDTDGVPSDGRRQGRGNVGKFGKRMAGRTARPVPLAGISYPPRKGVIDLIPREKLWGKSVRDANASRSVLCSWRADDEILFCSAISEYLDNSANFTITEDNEKRSKR